MSDWTKWLAMSWPEEMMVVEYDIVTADSVKISSTLDDHVAQGWRPIEITTSPYVGPGGSTMMHAVGLRPMCLVTVLFQRTVPAVS